MDLTGAIPTEGDWIFHSRSGMFTGYQETDSMMIQLLENYPMISDLAIPDSCWPGNEESTLMDISGNYGPDYSLKTTNSHVTGSSQETDLLPTSSDGFYNLSGSPIPTTMVTKNFHSNGNSLSTGFCAAENSSLYLIQGEAYVSIDGNVEEPGRYQCEELPASNQDSRNTSSKGKSMKRPKVPENDQLNKRSRKSQKSCNNEEDGDHFDIAPQLQPSGGMSRSEAAALNLNGRTRATRGSATDAQSVYARRRREGINKRLKVLQNLVPNGRKVDISTMLEEAVNYVKFLQLQIKMLSSDDMWMYAPICYNGMIFEHDEDESCHTLNQCRKDNMHQNRS